MRWMAFYNVKHSLPSGSKIQLQLKKPEKLAGSFYPVR
jgi:hypothetical protein